MTSLAEEKEEQQRWRLKPQFASLRVFDQLLENEFIPPDAHHAWVVNALGAIIRHAAASVPYYGGLFSRLGLRPEGVNSVARLADLPILTRQDVLDFHDTLTTRAYPRGDAPAGATKSSGTTGRPVVVRHSRQSRAMFTFLRQRASRWCRFDPMKSRVDVRPPVEIAVDAQGKANPRGKTVTWPAWRYIGTFFHTGEEHGFNNTDQMEDQVAFLKKLRPHYAMAHPGLFEEWLLANEGNVPVDSLEGLMGISSQLTPSLRAKLESTYGVPIHQGYGLNEVGMVAMRCSEGRYHVHTEHCFVEIVDADGRASAPGRTGRIVVTPFRNTAMPLIRYDTGDLAEAVTGACRCGRTLPSFGEIAGRFRRYAGLPEGTRERFQILRKAVENLPPADLTFLRRYQVYQDRQNHFTLKLRVVKPVPEAFRRALHSAWASVAGDPPSPLTIVEVDDIPTSPSGKLLDFTSEFYTDSFASPPPPTSNDSPPASATAPKPAAEPKNKSSP